MQILTTWVRRIITLHVAQHILSTCNVLFDHHFGRNGSLVTVYRLFRPFPFPPLSKLISLFLVSYQTNYIVLCDMALKTLGTKWMNLIFWVSLLFKSYLTFL